MEQFIYEKDGRRYPVVPVHEPFHSDSPSTNRICYVYDPLNRPGTGRWNESMLYDYKHNITMDFPSPIMAYIENESLLAMFEEDISNIELIPYFENNQILKGGE